VELEYEGSRMELSDRFVETELYLYQIDSALLFGKLCYLVMYFYSSNAVHDAVSRDESGNTQVAGSAPRILSS
jgi:hypothetical protein